MNRLQDVSVTCRVLILSVGLFGLLALFAAPAPAVVDQHDDEHGEEHGEEHTDDPVQLDRKEMEEFAIQVLVAGPGEVDRVRRLPGEVKVNDTRLAHISPRYPGIITEVRAEVGDVVEAGQVLAIIESSESLAPYEMTTLISGTVIDKHLTLGESVTRESTGYSVADLNNVWIDVTVYQRDLDEVKVGQKVTVTAGLREYAVTGNLVYITPFVDEHTRTATARLVVDNADGFWRPGMFVMARVLIDRFAASVVVPASTIQSLEGRDVVFVAAGDGFVPRPVTIGHRGDKYLEITSGLDVGQRYVAVGGFTFKAEMAKDSFGEGHEH